MNVCKNCGMQFEGEFCPNCGLSVNGTMRCIHCGAEIYAGSQFCNICGRSQTEEYAESKNSGGKNKIAGFFCSIGRWIKSHLKLVVGGTAALTAVILAVCIFIPMFTDIFKSSKVSQIKLGDSRAQVVRVLGEPVQERNGVMEYCSDNYKDLINKAADLTKEMETVQDGDRLIEILEEMTKLEQEAMQLTYGYIRIGIVEEGGVIDVLLDTKHNDTITVKKEVDKIVTEELPFGVDIKTCVVRTEVYYKDGSYKQYNLRLASWDIEENGNIVTVKWSDEWGSYSTYFQNGFTMGSTVKGNAGEAQYTLTALDEGLGNDLPNFKLTLTGGYFDYFKFREDLRQKFAIDEYDVFDKITEVHINSDDLSINATDISFGNVTAITVGEKCKCYMIKNGALYEKRDWMRNDNNTGESINWNVLIAVPKAKSGSFVISEGTTIISDRAFYDCVNLTDITIPNSVKIIDWEAFYGCSGLTSITIPDGVTSIGYYVFYGCSGLTSITIPNSVTSIDGDAFRDCSGLTSVTIGNGVTSIGYYAFSDCSGLTSINFNGTKAEWKNIKKGSDWTHNTGNFVVHCTDGDIAKADA